MWISRDKRRLLAKETANLPYLIGATVEEADYATECRSQILELVFDQFIRPDDESAETTSASRWKRAMQLWKVLLNERRASYFVDLRVSAYVEWIKTGEATVLPCTTEEVEDRNKGLPELQGAKTDVGLAREVRATILKHAEDFETRLPQKSENSDSRRKFDELCTIIRKETGAEWFIRKRPKSFLQYEKLFDGLVPRDFADTVSRGAAELKRMSELGKFMLLRKKGK